MACSLLSPATHQRAFDTLGTPGLERRLARADALQEGPPGVIGHRVVPLRRLKRMPSHIPEAGELDTGS